MELYKMEKKSATRWAFSPRRMRDDLNSLEVAGVESLTAWGLDQLTEAGALCLPQFFRNVGAAFVDRFSAWAGGGLWFVPDTDRTRQDYTLKTGEVFRGACVVGFALLLVFEEPDAGREVVYRVIC